MSSDFLKKKLRSILPEKFEQFVADIWAQYGYRTKVTSPGPDRGVDVRATREFPYPRTEVIQVKRYDEGNPVSSPDVQQYSALRKQEDADLALIVTTSRFTDEAKEIASALGVEILDVDQLVSTVTTDNHYQLLADYAPVTDTAGHRLPIEVMTDKIIESTGLKHPVEVRDSLRSFFESQSDSTIDTQMTLNAFGEQGGWEETTVVRWSSEPSLSTEEIADALLRDADRYKLGSPTTKNVALRAAISEIIDEQLRPAPNEMTASELADWFIETFDKELLPAAHEHPEHSRDKAERIIDTMESVAVNRLRVGEALERADQRDELRY